LLYPWKDIALQKKDIWLAVFAFTKGTSKEIILASLFPPAKALMVNTILFRVLRRTNLYMLALGGASIGKTHEATKIV
jgi:hypothetical protein